MRVLELVELMEKLDLGEAGRPRRPPHENLRAIQEALARGLADPEFRLDCIERDLSVWAGWEASGWNGMKPAMIALPELGLFVRVFFWPPGQVSPPHEHTSWTMSAVFHNRLQVMTYHWDRAIAARRLEKRSRFWAESGRVGYIYDPAIHSPSNPGERGAISFHIYNADDGPVLERQVGPIEGLSASAKASDDPTLSARRPEVLRSARESLYRVHAEAALEFPCSRTMEVLEALYRRGDPITRDFVAQSMRAHDAAAADTHLRRLAGAPQEG